jgi:hypothetical protein
MVDIIVTDKKYVIITVDKELKQKHFDEILKNRIIDEPRKTIVTIDLSGIIWIELDAALWFISFLNRLKKQENDIRIILPDPEKHHSGRLVWDYLITWKFFDALKECVDSPVNLIDIDQLKYIDSIDSNYRAMPLARRKIVDEQGEVHTLPHNLLEIQSIKYDNYLNGVSKYVQNFRGAAWATIRNYCGWNGKETTEFVNTVVEEGLINSFLHGENTFTNVAMKSDSKNVILVICDNGKGIPSSLRDTFNKKKELLNGKDYSTKEDAFLLTYFTNPEMIIDSLLIDQSTQREQGAIGRNGNGLFYLKDFILKHDGRLRIRSGKAWVGFEKVNNREKIEPIDFLIQSPGTLITIILPKTK